jgi:hypothetical protein
MRTAMVGCDDACGSRCNGCRSANRAKSYRAGLVIADEAYATLSEDKLAASSNPESTLANPPFCPRNGTASPSNGRVPDHRQSHFCEVKLRGRYCRNRFCSDC